MSPCACWLYADRMSARPAPPAPAAPPGVPPETPPEATSARLPEALRDGLLCLAVIGVLSAVIAIAPAGTGSQAPAVAPAVAYVFAAGFGALLLLRRIAPAPMLVLSVLATFAYYTLGLPTIGVALPVVAALFAAAERGRLRWAIGSGVVVFTVALLFRLRDDPQPAGILLGTDAVTNLALIAAGIALGHAVRSDRERGAQQRRITELTADQALHEAQLQLREERVRISRELHDTVGHALAVISLHSGVGVDAVGRDEVTVRRSLEQVRTQAAQSLNELRTMVRVLRSDDEPGDDEPGAEQGGTGAAPSASASPSTGAPLSADGRQVRSLADAPTILEQARSAGLEVRARIDADPAGLSPAVSTAAYRILQESVTNALRHADATRLEVDARIRGGRLVLRIADDGRGAAEGSRGGTSSGVGIIGMTERTRLLGGTLTTRSPGTGFEVEASIPARLEGER
jgi:signal transduction histidine kinase